MFCKLKVKLKNILLLNKQRKLSSNFYLCLEIAVIIIFPPNKSSGKHAVETGLSRFGFLRKCQYLFNISRLTLFWAATLYVIIIGTYKINRSSAITGFSAVNLKFFIREPSVVNRCNRASLWYQLAKIRSENISLRWYCCRINKKMCQ